MQSQQSFLGRGWPFPIRGPRTGPMRLIEGDEKIRQSIWLVLSTAPGERQMRPELGCGIHDLVFQPNTAALRGMVRERVRDALVRWEPRITVDDVRVDTPSGARNHLVIRIDYRVRSNNAVYNLVYPFFLQEGAR